MIWPDAMIFIFWMLSFKATFSLSSFTFIKRLFISSLSKPWGYCHLHIWDYWYFSRQSWFQLEKKCKKAKWLSGEALQIAVKRKEAKSKGEKERYKHLNAEFQRIAKRNIPHWRSGRVVVRRYPSSKVRSSGCALLEQPWRYPTPKVRENQVRW